MQADAEIRLLQAAIALRGEYPQLYEHFVSCLRVYAAEVLTGVMRAPPEALQRAQGMAIQANDLATLLTNAPQALERIRNKHNGRRPTASPT